MYIFSFYITNAIFAIPPLHQLSIPGAASPLDFTGDFRPQNPLCGIQKIQKNSSN